MPAFRTSLRLNVAVVALVALAGATTAPAPAAAAVAQEGRIRSVGAPTTVPDSFVVVFKDTVARDAVPAKADELTGRFGGRKGHTYLDAVKGFEVSMPEEKAKRLALDPSVSYVQRNGVYALTGTQAPTPSWGLDRIDQRALPLTSSYTFPAAGTGVKAYILDSGIRFSHNDFGGRAFSGFDAIDGGSADDGNGHGSHVAGIVGGTAYGVAKGVSLVAVRVLNDAGGGTSAQVIAGVDWVTRDHAPLSRAVANMSLGGGPDPALDAAVAASIADGITYGIAAGNANVDACATSPARVPSAITVGATAILDARSSFSNFGGCLDVFAPGSAITSAWNNSNTATNTISGTSMAAPHVAGAAALVLAQHPTYTPQQVRDFLVGNATDGKVTSPGAGSPNKLLYVVNPPANDFSISVSPASGSVTRGHSITATVSTAVTAGVPQAIALSASIPASGVTASFSPATVTAGASATLTISTSMAASPGAFSVSVIGTGSQATRTTRFALTVNPPNTSCSASNSTDVPIRDFTTVESPITLSGCPGNASVDSIVDVHIAHTYPGDLIVHLVAPDGSLYLLHNRTGGGTDNIDQTYIVNLAAETANGVWRLRVQDTAALDIGYLNSWTLDLAGPPATCSATNGGDVIIPDNATVDSAIAVAGCSGNASASSKVEVHIAHTYKGDLIVHLVAPDGSLYLLHNRTGGAADNIDQTYTVNLSGEARNGAWKLRVRDAATLDTGRIDIWSLTL